MATLIPADALKPMRWKNGSGATTQLAAFPPTATLDDFMWRLSIADVASSGPFSVFPNIDRILMLLEGPGMHLQLASRDVDLAAPFAQCTFAGEDSVQATLRAGPVRDCNLMLRRPLHGTLQAVAGTTQVFGPATFRVCHAWAGAVSVIVADAPTRLLQPRTTLLLDAADAHAWLRVDASATGAACIVATIELPA
jgi:environmental stress-induced protein Ves